MSNRRTTPDEFWARIKVGGPDECWPWLGCSDNDGSGQVSWEGKPRQACNVAYELCNGVKLGRFRDRPVDKQCVLRTCLNKLCCNPQHLMLGKKRNSPVCSLKGTSHPRAKLTDQQVLAIRARRVAGEMIKNLAVDFGIQRSCVSAICLRRTWAHIA